jgi:hypothetical protein
MDLGDRTLLQRSKSRRWVGNVECMDEIRSVNKICVQKDLEERLLGRHWLSWINIKTKKIETGCEAWIGSIWLRIGASGALVVYPD